jgi:hypothetical protein
MYQDPQILNFELRIRIQEAEKWLHRIRYWIEHIFYSTTEIHAKMSDAVPILGSFDNLRAQSKWLLEVDIQVRLHLVLV